MSTISVSVEPNTTMFAICDCCCLLIKGPATKTHLPIKSIDQQKTTNEPQLYIIHLCLYVTQKKIKNVNKCVFSMFCVMFYSFFYIWSDANYMYSMCSLCESQQGCVVISWTPFLCFFNSAYYKGHTLMFRCLKVTPMVIYLQIIRRNYL